MKFSFENSRVFQNFSKIKSSMWRIILCRRLPMCSWLNPIQWSRSTLESVQRLEWCTSEIPLDNWTSSHCMPLHQRRKFEPWPKWHSRWKGMSNTSSWLYKWREMLAWPNRKMTIEFQKRKFLWRIFRWIKCNQWLIHTCSVLYMTSAKNIELIGKREKMTPLLMSVIIPTSLVIE